MYEFNSPAKQELASKLAELLGSTVALKYLAQGYHWNVRGPQFYQFHEFFQEIYESLDELVDPLGENIRKMGYDAPATLEDFISLSCVENRETGHDPIAMSTVLYENVRRVYEKTKMAFSEANSVDEQGVADFLAGMISELEKWHWQLKTTIGADSTQVKTVQIGM